MPEYDPLLTMSALNMAIVSLHRITSTKDRLILDREYKSIINNIRMGEINADHELTSLYQEIVRVLHRGRLRDDLRASIESSNIEDKRRSIGEIVAGNVLPSFNVNPLKWLGKLASSSMSEYFRNEKGRARQEIYNEEKERRLRTDELNEYDELQRKLLDSSWKLLRQYSLPDSYRLTQNSLDKFYAAIQENDSSKRLRMLRYIEGDFSMYSPYWFYRAKAAYECEETEEAQKFFAKFNEVWRPVLRKDPYRVEALKYKIDALFREGLSADNAKMIHECLAEMRDNTELEDWPNNIYMGMMYFTLGDKDTAIDCVMCNIDFCFETENSKELLAKFESETPPKRFAATPPKSPEKPVKPSEAPKPEPVREVLTNPEPEPKPVKQSLKARAESGDAESQYQLGMSYEKHKDTTALASVVICTWLGVGWLVLHYLLPSSFIWCSLWIVFVCWIAFVLGVHIIHNMPEYYYEPRAIKWFSKAAENGHIEAMYRLAEIYCKENPRHYEAERWYKNAAVRGHIPSQLALSSIMYRMRYNGDYNAYMWAYLAYLCGGTENLGNKPEISNYPISRTDAINAEAEARRMFDDIQYHRQNTNSKERT